MNTEQTVLLTLIVSPEIEDAIVDWLLERDAISGFTSSTVSGHGASVHSMSPAEQVAGRRRQTAFQSCLSYRQAKVLVAQLESDFSGSGMHFWISPLYESGHLA